MESIYTTVQSDSQVLRLQNLPTRLRINAKSQFLLSAKYTERTFTRRLKEGKFTPEESSLLKQVLDNLTA